MTCCDYRICQERDKISPPRKAWQQWIGRFHSSMHRTITHNFRKCLAAVGGLRKQEWRLNIPLLRLPLADYFTFSLKAVIVTSNDRCDWPVEYFSNFVDLKTRALTKTLKFSTFKLFNLAKYGMLLADKHGNCHQNHITEQAKIKKNVKQSSYARISYPRTLCWSNRFWAKW